MEKWIVFIYNGYKSYSQYENEKICGKCVTFEVWRKGSITIEKGYLHGKYRDYEEEGKYIKGKKGSFIKL